jgi:hypothetical protein
VLFDFSSELRSHLVRQRVIGWELDADYIDFDLLGRIDRA